jgi:8-oxo-dGTP pyrophosphatase MutT (NUDIX family)
VKRRFVKPLAVSPPQEIFRNEFVHLYSVQASFGTFFKEYFVTDHGTRVGVIVLRGDEVLLVRQYRFLIDEESWEIPGGGQHASETPEQAAVRECREEAGIECRTLASLFDYRIGTDVSEGRVRLFRCLDWQESGDTGDRKETDGRAWVPVDECLRKVMSGELKDLMTVMALLILRQTAGGRP